MKKILLFIIIFLNAVFIFPKTKAMVCTDNLRIRDEPSINGKVIGSLNFGSIIYIYEEKGQEKINNGVYDYWYKISENENIWINSLYVNIFPFCITYIINENYSQYLNILDSYIKDNGKQYILCGENNIDSRKKDFELYLFKILGDETMHFPIIDNFSNKLFDFNNSILKYTNWENDKKRLSKVTYEIKNSEYLFKYGIKIGSHNNDIQIILGKPYKNKNNITHYKTIYDQIITDTFLHFNNEKLEKITIDIIMEK